MDSHDYNMDSCVPETQFEEEGGDVADFLSDDSVVDEVITINSDVEVIDIASDEDDTDVGPVRDMQQPERSGFDSTQPVFSRMHLHIEMLNILLPSPDPEFWASTYK